MVSHQNVKIAVCLAILLSGISLMFSDSSSLFGLFLVIIGLLLALWFWPIHFIWPGKESWKGSLLETPPYRYGKNADNWRTNRPQQVGDSFLLVIEKAPNIFVTAFKRLAFKIFKKAWILDVGRARLIDRIQFMRGDWSVAECPKRYAVTIQGLHRILPNWNRREMPEIEPGHNINIEFEHPERVTHIIIAIIEPRPKKHWAVGEIRIHEVRIRLSLSWGVNIR